VTDCYRCGSDEHFYGDCPERSTAASMFAVAMPAGRAATFEDHMTRIADAVHLWQSHQISIDAKRKAIAAENLAWYGQPVTRNGIKLTSA
jgi:hypothetical protein